MKLRSLWIDNYRTLQDVAIDFPDPQALCVGVRLPPIHLLLGVNGTGKTAVLRALAGIFAALDDRRAPDIPFALRYQVTRGRELVDVEIRGDGHGALSDVTFRVAQKDDGSRTLGPADWAGYLPSQVVVYTSGSLTEWGFLGPETRAARSDEEERLELLRQALENGGDIQEIGGLRDILDFSVAPVMEEVIPGHTRLFTDDDLTLALLTTLAIDEDGAAALRDDLYRRAGVKRLRAFALRLEPLAVRRQEGVILEQVELLIRSLLEDRLEEDAALKRRLDELLAWRPPELPAQLLDRVRELARLAAHRHRNPDGSYHLLFELDVETRLKLGGSQGLFATPTQFFDFLADLRERGVLAQADMILDKTDLADPILNRHLSDGEREFLGRMALFLLMRQPNALFMLDEPETHFNDVWKRELVYLLANALKGFDSLVLLSTHSSIVITEIAHPQMVLLVKDEAGHTRPLNVRIPTYGADPSDMAVAVLGAGGSGGPLSDAELDAALERGDPEELERLLAIVSPGYWRFRIRNRLESLDASPDEPA